MQSLNLNSFEQLPIENKMMILSNLDRNDILNMCQLGSEWNSICKDNNLWKNLLANDFGVRSKRNSFDKYKKFYLLFEENIKKLLKLSPLRSEIVKWDVLNQI